IMIVGIKLGYATPTEVSAVAVSYGIALSVVIYRSIGFRSFITIAVDCGLLVGLDFDSGESANRPNQGAAPGRRQPDAVPDRIDRAADHGRLAARRVASADHFRTTAAAACDPAGDRQHPLCDGDPVGDGRRHLHPADRHLLLYFVRRVRSRRGSYRQDHAALSRGADRGRPCSGFRAVVHPRDPAFVRGTLIVTRSRAAFHLRTRLSTDTGLFPYEDAR